MDILDDYVNWKLENHEMLSNLVKNKSKTISRFTSVIVVVDYLYEQSLKRKLSEDENLFFNMGFDYIHDNFYTIKTLLEYKFKNNYQELESCAKTINLLLYVNEFQGELLGSNIDTKALDDFEEKINIYLDKNQNIPDTFFPMLDDIINPIFEKNNLDFHPIESIFYEIAVEYGIYKPNELDIYNAVFNLKKEKK
ncbi:MAG: hypothetical protein K2I42_07385, partial [Anaeroplasmataceae bacterium]|nr:hypothetical protein [Anaeroplasmataceae bacterium]